ncbi:Os10g0124300 [Oryza sativa Japonica Group]|uniref:Os10g0124300 protein n=1 Tax=Oryza sativa subsp. japonica TaxID=39947 RepID=Q0IZ79_ORYSJ|nr:Os10g0124300 [Oryza sativa Japonica Group]|eukprot:NP_001064072.1 Os10g0124300 [Oryza sativa Japonica Group]
MEVTAGAMRALLPKLAKLLKDEYNLEKHVREGVKSLEIELTMMHAALRKVAEVPLDQLDDQVKIWASKVREISYDMEDAGDAFMVRVEDDSHSGPSTFKNRVKRPIKKISKLFRKAKELHQIADAIKEAQALAQQMAGLRERYSGLELQNSGMVTSTIDPRLTALYIDATDLVGIDHAREELIKTLTEGEDSSKQQLKIISIVGFGGPGKTTLARAVHEKIEAQFDCSAFVSVSRNPDVRMIFKKMLHQLDKVKYANINESSRDEIQLIDELREFLQDKRYFIIIDDLWDERVWDYIKCAFPKDNLGSRLIITTRNVNVSKACCSANNDIIYKMKPLSEDDSKKLFYKRIFPHGNGCPCELEEVSNEILKKCGGVPLAIITIASLLANKELQTKDQWFTLHNSIGRGLTEGRNVEDMQKILSFSYYDLPSHLKSCLLCLSVFPEDYEIRRNRLIWRWIAEGFVQQTQNGGSLFEQGENYFNELVNRSMIQPIDIDAEGRAKACRVHDMVLDLICHMSSQQNFITVFNDIGNITCSRNKLRRLMCLRVSFDTRLPDKLGEMTSLEELSSISTSKCVDIVKELRQLTRLRVLAIEWEEVGEKQDKALVECLGSLHRLQILNIYAFGGCLNLMQEGWMPPTCGLIKCDRGIYKSLENWQHRGACSGEICGQHQRLPTRDRVPSMFPRGAMPRVRYLEFSLRAWDNDMAIGNGSSGDLDLAMGHLPSLERVSVTLLVHEV